jgi:hypothetical protein
VYQAIVIGVDISMTIQEQNFYFPLLKGKYEVTPGLHALGTDFGNGYNDTLIFQIDTNFTRYRDEKISSRKERLDKYYCLDALPPVIESYISRFIIHQLCQEHPKLFDYEQHHDHYHLFCRLTGEQLIFGSDFTLLSTQPDNFGYQGCLDALAMQVQEDLALVEISPAGDNRIKALHLCFPNHWAAEDKIGQTFLTSHAPVPGMEKLNPRANQLLASLLNRGPFVRFAWGLATDNRLNHHPIAPENIDIEQWQGRHFDPTHPELYLRVERQVLKGFPAINTILFTIRTYFYDVASLIQSDDIRQALLSALRSMSPESQRYKGLTPSLPMILEWLET